METSLRIPKPFNPTLLDSKHMDSTKSGTAATAISIKKHQSGVISYHLVAWISPGKSPFSVCWGFKPTPAIPQKTRVNRGGSRVKGVPFGLPIEVVMAQRRMQVGQKRIKWASRSLMLWFCHYRAELGDSNNSILCLPALRGYTCTSQLKAWSRAHHVPPIHRSWPPPCTTNVKANISLQLPQRAATAKLPSWGT